MERILEPTLMLDAEQCSAFNTAPRKILRDGFLSNIQHAIKVHNSVIDLGCGPADYAIELCKMYQSCNITAIDGSPNMIKIAQQAILSASLDHRIILKNMLFDEVFEKYDTVISTNTLHHIPDPDDFWKVIKRVGKQNVFVLDLLRPESDEDVELLINMYASFTDESYRTDFRNSLKASFSLTELQKQLLDNNLSHLKIETIGNKVVMIYGNLYS